MAAALRLHRARGRLDAGETLLEGPHLVEAAVAAGVPLRRVFIGPGDAEGPMLAAAAGAEQIAVDEATLRRLGTTEAPQSPIAVIANAGTPPAPGGRVLVAWGVSDPGNCGTLIRVAAAFGYGYLSGPDSADPWSPKVLRSAAGAHFAVPLGHVSSLGEARSGGREVIATVARGGGAPGPLGPSCAVLVGNEARGLPDDVVAAADRRITIPTTGAVESLNAAVAGAIIAFLGAAGGPVPGTSNLSPP